MENLLTDNEKQIKNYRREPGMTTENSINIKEFQTKFHSYQKNIKKFVKKKKII